MSQDLNETPLNESMTFHESYGTLPVHILRMVRKFNVSPSDYDMLTDTFGTDWDGMREAITDNIIPGTRSFNVFGLVS